MAAPSRRRPPFSPPPPVHCVVVAALAAAVALLALVARPASASSSTSSPAAAASVARSPWRSTRSGSGGAFLGAPQARRPFAPTRRQASSGGGSNEKQQQRRRLVVEDESFDALMARAHDEALRRERALAPGPAIMAPPVPGLGPGLAPRPPEAEAEAAAAEDREVLEELTGLLYHALNERSTETMARLWLEDDPAVLFFAGDGAGPVRGYAAVVDMLRTVRQEERRLDPARSKGPLMLHPPVEASGFRVVVNGMHAWVTCRETMARGLTKEHPFDPKDDYWVGTNLFRRFNGQWRLVMHWSGRLAPVHEQLQEMLEQKKAKEMAKQQGGGGGPGGRAGGSKGMQGRMPFRPEDLGLPPGMSLDGAEAEITWELDDEDLAELEFEEGEEGEWEFDPETGTMEFSRAGIINEDGTVTFPTTRSGGGGGMGQVGVGEEGEGMGLLATWHRTAVFREKTKKALGAVRRLAREGLITKLEKAKLIHSVIASTSHDEISQVEMAYDLLVKRGVADLEEFADQCKAISADYAW